MKTCTKCGAEKEDTEFLLRRRRCQECHLAGRKVWREKNRTEILKGQNAHYQENRERINAKNRAYYQKNKKELAASQKAYREKHIEEIRAQKKGYYKENKREINAARRDSKRGLAPGDFERMFNKQGGVCAICSGPGGKRGLVVDHDHESGKIRAVLCSKCNIALGCLNDSSVIAQLAVEYLKQHGK